jgi:hypothetical protein
MGIVTTLGSVQGVFLNTEPEPLVQVHLGPVQVWGDPEC